MKTNFSVNIGGRTFNIDDDAYQLLNAYLAGLKNHFGSEPGNEEILDDIESRISDLFAQQMQAGQLAVTSEMVSKVISELGHPSDWDEPSQSTNYETSSQKTDKRMYRDPDRRMIAGVASGIAAWARIDPVWVRLAFVFISVFYLTGVLFYLVLWFVIPEAQSMSDRLEMHGQEVNVDNLMRRFRQERDRFQQNNGNTIRDFMTSFFSGLGRMFRFCFHLLGRLLGVVLLLMVIGWSVALTVLMVIQDDFQMGNYILFDASFIELITMMIPNSALRWQMYFATGLAIFSLFALMTYAGLKLVIRWKHNTRQIPMVLTVLFIAGLFSSAMLVFKIQESYTHNGAVHRMQTLKSSTPETLNIQMQRRLNAEYINFPGMGFTKESKLDSDGRFFHSTPSISIRSSAGDSLYIEFLTSARSGSESDARILSENILYNWQFSENELILDRYFSVPLKDTYHRQELDIIVYAPENTRLYLDKTIAWEISWRSFAEDNSREEGWFKVSKQGLTKIQSDSISE